MNAKECGALPSQLCSSSPSQGTAFSALSCSALSSSVRLSVGPSFVRLVVGGAAQFGKRRSAVTTCGSVLFCQVPTFGILRTENISVPYKIFAEQAFSAVQIKVAINCGKRAKKADADSSFVESKDWN